MVGQDRRWEGRITSALESVISGDLSSEASEMGWIMTSEDKAGELTDYYLGTYL